MKKIIFGIVALFIATFTLYAFSNTGDSEAVETETLNVYHYISTDANGKIHFALGEPELGECEQDGDTPCRFTSNLTLTSPMTPAAIKSNATVTAWRD